MPPEIKMWYLDRKTWRLFDICLWIKNLDCTLKLINMLSVPALKIQGQNINLMLDLQETKLWLKYKINSGILNFSSRRD